MIPAKRLAELRQVGWDPTYAEILELVTAYEAARKVFTADDRYERSIAYDEVDRLAELLESRDLEIAEFHATQLPVAYYMRGYATALRAAPAAEPTQEMKQAGGSILYHLVERSEESISWNEMAARVYRAMAAAINGHAS